MAHHFLYDVKLRLLAHSRSFLANQKARNAIVGAENLLKANKLSLNVAKTEFMVFGSRQKLLVESHNEINIKLEDQVISIVDHAKSLGLIIGNRLSWSNHNELCKKVTSAIGALRRIRPLSPNLLQY